VVGFLLSFGHYTHRGYVSVVESGDSLRLIGRGLHLRAPWHRVTVYPVQCREVRVEIFDEGPEADIHFDAVLYIGVCADSIVSLHKAYNGAYVEKVISPMLTEFLREYGEAYGLWESDTGPRRVTGAILDYLGRAGGEYGINVSHMWLRAFEVKKGDTSLISQ
jgi:hypothetical protein